MKTVIVFDHPYTLSAGFNQPHHRSYSAAIAQTCLQVLKQHNEEVDVIDLYADHFNPVMSAEELANWRTKQIVDPVAEDYYQRLAQADQIIFIFPIWWEMMPTMTKDFLDKVFSKDHYQPRRPHILPKKPRIVTFTVSGTPTFLYKLVFGNPITKMLKRGTFNKLGLSNYHWHNFNPEHRSEIQRQNDLKSVTKYLI